MVDRSGRTSGLEELPAAVRALLDRAVVTLAQDQRRTICPHGRDAAALFVCVHHPAAGLLCIRCTKTHAARHDHAVEFACDQCGRLGDRIHAIGEEHCAELVEVIDRCGKRVLLVGAPVWLVGAGMCCSCARCDRAAA